MKSKFPEFFPYKTNSPKENFERKIELLHIIDDVIDFLGTFCAELTNAGICLTQSQIKKVSLSILDDLKARIEQDPIAHSESLIYFFSRSFHIIFYYRIANTIFYLRESELEKRLCKFIAYKISERATQLTGIEIHPQAIIGKNFVIDHGVNTIIGATAVIGDNCTILENVVLGSRKITHNNDGKRHPTLGDNVQISGNVRIYGPISIGNNSKIGSGCIITTTLPENSLVKLITKQQVYTVDNKI